MALNDHSYLVDKMTVKRRAMTMARELRKHMTPAEIVLWNEVKNRKFYGFKFLRQHPIFYDFWGKKKFFIADFFCKDLSLIVEIDGGIHEQQKEYDEHRTEILEAQKELKVIRFKNEQVLSNINGVLKELKKMIGR